MDEQITPPVTRFVGVKHVEFSTGRGGETLAFLEPFDAIPKVVLFQGRARFNADIGELLVENVVPKDGGEFFDPSAPLMCVAFYPHAVEAPHA